MGIADEMFISGTDPTGFDLPFAMRLRRLQAAVCPFGIFFISTAVQLPRRMKSDLVYLKMSELGINFVMNITLNSRTYADLTLMMEPGMDCILADQMFQLLPIPRRQQLRDKNKFLDTATYYAEHAGGFSAQQFKAMAT